MTPDRPDDDYFSIAQPDIQRIRCYLAGGKDCYLVDREIGDRIRKAAPGIADNDNVRRAFERRAVENLANQGIDQFLVFAAGFDPQVHTIAHHAKPESRVVYVEDNPLVLAHGRAIYAGDTDNQRIEWLRGNLPAWQDVLTTASRILAPGKPVAVVLNGATEFIPAKVPVAQHVQDLLAQSPGGSALAVCQTVTTFAPDIVNEVKRQYSLVGIPYTPRDAEEFETFFAGLHLVPPGIMPPHRWNPELELRSRVDQVDASVSCLAGVGYTRRQRNRRRM